MNNTRRRQLRRLADRLHDVRAELEQVAEEEQTAWDNIPEAFCDKQDAAEAVVDLLNEAVEQLDELNNTLSGIFE